MSIVKSFATGLGDTYYIRHGTDNFTIIDCRIPDDRPEIIQEIELESLDKGVTRFISTHPDDDHIRGLADLDDAIGIRNFYVVANEATKPDDTVDFERYRELRDSSKAFHIEQGCTRRWMNRENEERGSSGIGILWPDRGDARFQAALAAAAAGRSPNNISAIIRYRRAGGASMLWLGDLESDFMAAMSDELQLPSVDVVFAAHHGRARMPAKWIAEMDPQLIVIGEAPAEHLCHYEGRDHIRQNACGDITFECLEGATHIYVGRSDYEVDFLLDEGRLAEHGHYIGSLATDQD